MYQPTTQTRNKYGNNSNHRQIVGVRGQVVPHRCRASGSHLADWELQLELDDVANQRAVCLVQLAAGEHRAVVVVVLQAVDKHVAGLFVLVGDPVVAAVLRIGVWHQVGDQQVVVAAVALLMQGQLAVVDAALPCAFLNGCRTHARPAVGLGRLAAVAVLPHRAPLALKELGVGAHAEGRCRAVDQSLGAFNQLGEALLVKVHPLAVHVVGVLVHGQVQGAFDLHQAHVDGHLVVVLGLCRLHLLGHQLGKALV